MLLIDLVSDPASGSVSAKDPIFSPFMAGARRQIFMAFAVLLMVQKFDYSVQEVTILFVNGTAVK